MTSKGRIVNPKGDIKDALEALNDYAYRKEFGLSYKEFFDEPLEVYNINQEILSSISEIQRQKEKQLERDQKR